MYSSIADIHILLARRWRHGFYVIVVLSLEEGVALTSQNMSSFNVCIHSFYLTEIEGTHTFMFNIYCVFCWFLWR